MKDENKSTAQLLDEYAAMPGVLYVQPNYLYELTSLNGSYNDPYIDKQWFLEDSNIEGNPAGVGVENAWRDGNYGGDGYQASTTSQSAASNSATEEAVVAVIDTGVRYDHPDLKDSMWTGGEEVAEKLGWSTDVDNDGNFAWNMILYPGDSSEFSLTANKSISADAVEQINYLAVSSYAQSDIGGGFYVSLSAKGKEKDAAGNFERIELDSVGINQGSDGAYLTALTSLSDEQKDAIDWENFTLYMSCTNTSSSDTWDLTFNFNACALVSQTTPYTSWDGTSMATLVASGVAALIAQDLSDKGLSPEQQAAEVRARLIGGAIRDNDSLMGTSRSDGRLDVKKALEDPNPVITDVQQSAENPSSATISGFFFGSSPSIKLLMQMRPMLKQCSLVWANPLLMRMALRPITLRCQKV